MRHAIGRIAPAMVLLALVVGGNGQANADPNLVMNGGFETGDFTGWTQSGNPGFVSIITSDPHTGNYAASFGAVGTATFLAQNLTTVAGDSYTISFWLQNDGGTPNSFSATFGNDTLVTLPNAATFSYKLYSYTDTATSTSTALSFAFQQDPSFWEFDDVSVTDNGAGTIATPEPSTIALACTAVPVGLIVAARRRKAKTVS